MPASPFHTKRTVRVLCNWNWTTKCPDGWLRPRNVRACRKSVYSNAINCAPHATQWMKSQGVPAQLHWHRVSYVPEWLEWLVGQDSMLRRALTRRQKVRLSRAKPHTKGVELSGKINLWLTHIPLGSAEERRCEQLRPTIPWFDFTSRTMDLNSLICNQ